MPFMFPRIDLKFNMQGISNQLQRTIGANIDPMDLYEVFNTARDPSGQPYWAAVNYGTPVKYNRSADAQASLRSGLGSLNWNQLQRFWGNGRLISQRVTAGNPAHHMRERALPLIRKYWTFRIKAASGQKIPLSDLLSDFEKTGKKEFIKREHLGPTFNKPGFRTGNRGGDNFFLSIMEDLMDYSVAMLAKFTPELQSQYYSKSYTTEPGTLKNSYFWQRLVGTSQISAVKFSNMKRRVTMTRLAVGFRSEDSAQMRKLSEKTSNARKNFFGVRKRYMTKRSK